MIIKKQTIKDSTLELSWLKGDGLILDIETTGFSAKYASIYMIGLVYIDIDQKIILEQWLCEKESDEYEILYKFNQLLTHKNRLYHFNGDQFDLPFIKKRMALYKIVCHEYTSYDGLKHIRPFRQLFALRDLKLKTVEAYFGYLRDDPFTGGELIEVYNSFKNTYDERLMQTLLLHNYEDLLGLLSVLSNQDLLALLNQFTAGSHPIVIVKANFDQTGVHMSLEANHQYKCAYSLPWFHLKLEPGYLHLHMPVKFAKLKHFFETPKDYYYLVNEDYAIHKSVGKFVQKSHRVQATKDTCYIKQEGAFLPAYRHFKLPLPLFYEEGNQAHGYISLEDMVEQNLLDTYVKLLLTQL